MINELEIKGEKYQLSGSSGEGGSDLRVDKLIERVNDLEKKEFIEASDKGSPGGVATLNDSGKVPQEQLEINVSGGNVDLNAYAKKSIYGDNAVSLGRTAGSNIGNHSFAFGNDVEASSNGAHAEGFNCKATEEFSHAEGASTESNGYASHTEGGSTIANHDFSHAEGSSSIADGRVSHAEGRLTEAIGDYSHAEGDATTAENYASHVSGKYNVAMIDGGDSTNKNGHAFVVGNGTDKTTRSNALSLMYDGTLKTASTISASSTADYAEFFEWDDGNPDNEDRVGHFVALNADKIKIASGSDDYILGVISGRPFVLGNGDCDTWNGMYLRDEFNREILEPAPKMEYVNITKQVPRSTLGIDSDNATTYDTVIVGHEERHVIDEDGNPVYNGTRPKLNPDYDYTQQYVPRSDRKEWAPVGMLGMLSVYDDGSCIENGYCRVTDEGIATAADHEYSSVNDRITKNYKVIKRINDKIIKIIFR